MYRPGDVLAGRFSLEGVAPADIRAVELSVLWHTEGKGEEDMSVHYFERVEPHNGEAVDFRAAAPLQHRAAQQPVELRGIDRQGLLARAGAGVSGARQGTVARSAVSVGQRAASARGGHVTIDIEPTCRTNPFSTRLSRAVRGTLSVCGRRKRPASDRALGKFRLARPNRGAARIGQVDAGGQPASNRWRKWAGQRLSWRCTTSSAA